MNTTNRKNGLKERCFCFALAIIKFMDRLPNKRSAWVIEDQLIRSATSIGANLVEARSSSSRLEFKKFNEIALKSANETIYWLELLKAAKLLPADEIDKFLDESGQLANMLASGVIKLKSKF